MSFVEIPRFMVVIITVLFIILGGFGFAYLSNKYDKAGWIGIPFFIYFVISLMLIGFSCGILPR